MGIRKTHKGCCNSCGLPLGEPQSQTNRTLVVPVAGASPEIGPNGNWWVNGVDTGRPSQVTEALGIQEYGDNA